MLTFSKKSEKFNEWKSKTYKLFQNQKLWLDKSAQKPKTLFQNQKQSG